MLELLPQHLRRVGLFPAGRLDKDTEGLLLLTNDGPLAHRLLAPRHHVDKTYFVRVDGELDGSDAAAFAAGMMLEDGLACLPAGLEVLEQPDTALVTLHEGKYHQIKRMLAARGKPVVYLKRLDHGVAHMLGLTLERGSGGLCLRRRWNRSAAGVGAARAGNAHGQLARHSRACHRFGLALRCKSAPCLRLPSPRPLCFLSAFGNFNKKILQNLLKRAKRPGIIERKWTREGFCPPAGESK